MTLISNVTLLGLVGTKNNETRIAPINGIVRDTLIAVCKYPQNAYIFFDKSGNRHHFLRKSFLNVCKNSGIINFHFHDLRHTYASQLIMSGVDLRTTQELLGHKDLRMTIRYAYLSPDHKRKAVDTLAKQMDTFWSHDQKKEASDILMHSQLFENKVS